MIYSKLVSNLRKFSTLKVPKSVTGDLPPLIEETVKGRYSGILFKLASQNQKLDVIYNDLDGLNNLIKKSPKFQEFLENKSFNRSEQLEIFSTISSSLNDLTNNFINVLIDNKKLSDFESIIEKFSEYIKLLNKEENIRIISCKELTSDEKNQIKSALDKKYKGSNFDIKYEIEPTILGGLQIYFGNSFLDCSAASRVQRLRTEIMKVTA